MSPFRKSGFPGFYYRLAHGGRSRVVGLDTTDANVAKLMENWIMQCRHDRRWDVIDGILDRVFTLPDAYDHRNNLDAWLAQRTEVDVDPLVARWNGRGKRKRSDVYLRQVRAFIPPGQRFPLSRFRRREIAAFLEGLDVSEPTKNRYKASLSQFGAWLVRHEYLDANPVREAGSFSEHEPRTNHRSVADAKRIVDALSGDARVAAALMANGMEWSAVAALTKADIDLEARTAAAHGTKNRFRNRLVSLTEDWSVPIIAQWCRELTPIARLVTSSERAVLKAHDEAAAALGLPRHTLHDWRHTYAVTAIKRGDDHQAIKRNLGHSPHSALLYRVYGVYMHEPTRNTPKVAPVAKIART